MEYDMPRGQSRGGARVPLRGRARPPRSIAREEWKAIVSTTQPMIKQLGDCGINSKTSIPLLSLLL